MEWAESADGCELCEACVLSGCLLLMCGLLLCSLISFEQLEILNGKKLPFIHLK